MSKIDITIKDQNRESASIPVQSVLKNLGYIRKECISTELYPTISVAIMAVHKHLLRKKVLEKKEIKDFNGRIYSYRGKCPCCCSDIAYSNYCEECGQKLDWT